MAVKNNKKELNIKQIVDYIKFGLLLIILYMGFWLWRSYDYIMIPLNNQQMAPTFAPKEFHVGYRYRDWKEIRYDHFVYYDFPIKKDIKRRESLFFGRVIGLPGDRIHFQDGRCYRNGQPLEERYITNPNQNTENYAEIIVPRDSIYLLIDNRSSWAREIQNLDSRFTGPLPIHTIIGHILPN